MFLIRHPSPSIKRQPALMRLALALVATVIATSVGAISESTATSFAIMEYDDTAPNPPLSGKEQELVSRLSKAEIERLDKELLANCTHQWRKVAMVIGMTMGTLESRTFGIPAMYYAHRVAKLVREGRLESQGDLQRMRYSEVRLPNK